jgi:hypothetical protein
MGKMGRMGVSSRRLAIYATPRVVSTLAADVKG